MKTATMPSPIARIHAFTLLLALLVILLTLPAGSQTQQKKEAPPEGGTPKPFVLPAAERFTLPNGLRVTMVPYGTFPKVQVSVITRVGNLNESADQVWLADLTGELMKEGTPSRSAEKLAEEVARMGGAISIGVGADQTTTSADVLSEFGPDVARVLADVVRNPLLPDADLARLKNDMLRRLAIQKSQPNAMALERFRKLMYPDHAYGRVFPSEPMVQGYTTEAVRKFHEENFGATRTHVYVAGRFDAAAMRKAITAAFSDWQRGPAPLINTPKPVSKRLLDLVDRPGATQSTLYIGLPVVDPSHPDHIGLQVMNTLLGGSFASRITSNIREDKGYTYSPFSQLSARYRDTYWVQVADVTTAVTGPSLKEIFHEIDRLQKEAPAAAELKGIQNYMAGIFVLQNSSRAGVIGRLNFVDLHGLDSKYLETYVTKVHAVTPADVQKMASQYIRPDKMTIVVVGDKEKISEQISSYATASLR